MKCVAQEESKNSPEPETASKSAKWRRNLKLRNPEGYTIYLKQESERNKKARHHLTATQRIKVREQTRLRVQKYRLRIKMKELNLQKR